jgi:hypothetical protein
VEAEGLQLIGELTEIETGKGPMRSIAARCCVMPWRRPARPRRRRWRSSIASHPTSPSSPADGAPHPVRRGRTGQLHIYAARAEKERALIAERTRLALARKKADGARARNRTNLAEASALGHAANRRNADAFAANVLPIVRQIQTAGVTGLADIAKVLNDRGIRTARGSVAQQHGAQSARADLTKSKFDRRQHVGVSLTV